MYVHSQLYTHLNAEIPIIHLIHTCTPHTGISAEPLGHGNKPEVTKLPRFKKDLRLVVSLVYILSCVAQQRVVFLRITGIYVYICS